MSRKTKQRVQMEQQFLFTLSKIIEAFPQYTLAQHLSHFMRKKNETKEVYFWQDELILQKVEEYYDELKGDLTSCTEYDND